MTTGTTVKEIETGKSIETEGGLQKVVKKEEDHMREIILMKKPSYARQKGKKGLQFVLPKEAGKGDKFALLIEKKCPTALHKN